jgi:hypothetical protein
MGKSSKIISKILEKRGISDVKELSDEERNTFEKWKVVLGGENVTIDSIKEFCRSQISIIESKCDGITGLTIMQQACIHVYINLLKAIEAPEKERESLERYLNQLIQS